MQQGSLSGVGLERHTGLGLMGEDTDFSLAEGPSFLKPKADLLKPSKPHNGSSVDRLQNRKRETRV